MVFRVALALALLCFGGVAYAGDKPLYEAAPAWVTPGPKLDAATLTDDDPAILVMDQQQKLEDGQVWIYASTAMRIASPEMLTQAGTISLPWDPSKGDLIFHSIEILRGSERIDVLKSGQRFTVLQREQMLERAFLSGMLTATMPVEGLRIGDVLQVSFSMTRKDPVLKGQLQTMAPLLFKPMPVKFGRLRVIWPVSMKLDWKAHVQDGAFRPVKTKDGYNELSVVLPFPELDEMPSDAPGRFQPLPIFEAATFASWSDVGATMAPLYRTEGTIAPGSPLAGEVAKIAAASQDPRVRTASALRLVQDQVRYLFRGMDDGAYVPQAPAHTWSVRYGDCKAKTLLLLAMLRDLGVEAEAVLVNSSGGDVLPKRVPMPGAFDHVIVRATIGGETLWLDGTAGGARLADLGDVPPFRNALPLRETGAALLPMPMHANARPDADVDVEIDARAGIGFPAPFKLRAALRGGSAMGLRMTQTQMGREKALEMAGNTAAQYVANAEVVDRDLRYDEESGTMIVTASGIARPGWSKEEGRFKLGLDTAVESLGFDPDRGRAAWKDIPVSTGDLASSRVATRIRLPGTGTGFAFEGDQTLPATLAGAVLSRKAGIEGEWLTVEDRVVTGVSEVAPADIAVTRQQVTLARSHLLKAVAPASAPPRWQQIAAAKQARVFEPILAAYAKRIAADPKKAEGYTGRATFLESIYDHQAAMRDVEKVIAIAPTTENHLWRARLWSALGDDKKALGDVNSARTLDPGSADAIVQFATLRAHGGAADEALTIVKDKVAAGGKEKNRFLMLQAELLAQNGKPAEAIAALDAAIAAKPGDPALLNSRCWVKGTANVALDTALKDCTKAIELSEQSAGVLDSRGLVYFRLGRMEEALADFDAALDQTPDLAASLFMRGVIRKQTGAAGGDADLAAARMIWPRVDEDYARYGIKP
jgi:tetratricopeptide (TPR) repeat protein